MKDIINYTRGSLNPKNIIDTITYNIQFSRNNPDYFYPSGIWTFCGPQGSGKTLSMVQCALKMMEKYPKALVVSNIEFKGIDRNIIAFEDYSQLEKIKNGIYGIIFVLDEIHVLWNSLESKEIPISEMACFCQMRKDRRVILSTSQVYGRIAKPIREQLQYIIDCKNYFGVIQINKVLDPSDSIEQNGTIMANCVGTQVWFHNPSLYRSYDTLFKVNKADRKKEVKKNDRISNRSYERSGGKCNTYRNSI